MLQFSFGNAFMHFRRTGAPAGFAWKYILSYCGATILLFGFVGVLFGSVFAAFVSTSLAGDQDGAEAVILDNLGALGLIYGLLIPLSLLFYAIFEACYQRRYVRADGFKLRIGGDELRLMVVYLIWIAFVLVMYLLAIAIIVGAAQMGELGIFVGSIISTAAWLYFAVRLSAAASLTIRDQKIRFLASWRVTKGRFWVMFGAYLTWLAAFFLAYFVITLLSVSVLAGLIGANGFQGGGGVEALGAAAIIIGIVFYIALLSLVAYLYYIWAGPAALAARTDPDYAGYDDLSSVFS